VRWARLKRRTAGGEVMRFRPDATIDRRIRMPALKATTLVSGGPDLPDRYISTGDNNKQPSRGGSSYRLRSDIPGLPAPKARR
jgi:sugar lactone lactonase YvrE